MSSPDLLVASENASFRRSVSWPAIFAGLFAATALQFLFLLLGAGLGFAAYDPIGTSEPLEALSKGALIIQGISAVASLWFGGWIAGRFTPFNVRATGGHHGFLVWCASMIAGAAVVAIGAGWAVGGAAKLAGNGLSAAGKPVAAELANAAKSASQRSTQTINSFVDEAISGERPAARTGQTVRAEREITFALTKLFRPGANEGEARATAIRVLDENTDLSTAEATERVDAWIAGYRDLQTELATIKAEVETKARAAAEKAADALAAFSIVSFFAFLLGAISASCGGKHGAKCATRHEAVVVLD